MRSGKVILGLLTAVLLAAALLLGYVEYGQVYGFSLSVTVSTEDGAEQIRCWQNEEGDFYAFLPGGADLSRTTLHPADGFDARLDGRELTDGTCAGAFQPDIAYPLTYRQRGEQRQTTLTFLTSEEIPALYMQTRSGSVSYIQEEPGNEEPGSLRLYSSDGKLEQKQEIRAVQCRGNFTFYEEKAAFGLTLAEETDLLGMGQASKWVLLANTYDSSNLRNKIVYDFAGDFGLEYSPDSRWVELYLNGEYRGLYLLCEKNEVHEQRVNIQPETGFLVSKEQEFNLQEKKDPYVKLDSGYAMRVRHSAFDYDTLTEILQSAENAILAPDGMDPVTGKHFTELIDLDSWVRKYLVEEIFGNSDAGFGSQYYYYEAGDGKIYAGPVWDYDLTMASVDPRGIAHKPMAWPGEETPWMSSLMQQPEFYDYTVSLFQEEFLPLLEQLLNETIDRYTDQISAASRRNSIRWNTGKQESWTRNTIEYLEERRDFFRSLWLDGTEYSWVSMYFLGGPHGKVYARAPGEKYYDPAPHKVGIALGWYTMDTDEYVDITQPVRGDVTLYLKYPEEPEVGLGQWIRESLTWLLPFGTMLTILMVLVLWDGTIHPSERRSCHGRQKRNKIPS